RDEPPASPREERVRPPLERFLVLSNAPARGDESRPDDEEIDRCERASFELLARCGLQLRKEGAKRARLGSVGPTRTSPKDFDAMFPGTGGALYGSATHGPFAAFRRPTARTKIRGLYLAG